MGGSGFKIKCWGLCLWDWWCLCLLQPELELKLEDKLDEDELDKDKLNKLSKESKEDEDEEDKGGVAFPFFFLFFELKSLAR